MACRDRSGHGTTALRKCSQLTGALSPVNHKGFYTGLRETFVKIYIVQRTSKAELSPEEQSEKAESCWENLWNEIQLKGP